MVKGSALNPCDSGRGIGYQIAGHKERGGLKSDFLISVLVLAGLSGCGPNYSPDTYASNAAQQANKVEQGVVVGVRTVAVSAAGIVGTASGAAAGGIAGSQVGAGPISAFTALGGSLVGGIGGSAVEHVTADTTAFEYIIRKPNGDLVSVTQKDKTPLALGQKVLVIAGTQARVVPDYTVSLPSPPAKSGESGKPAEEAKGGDTKTGDAEASEAKAGETDRNAPNANAKPSDPDRVTVQPNAAPPSAGASPPGPSAMDPSPASSSSGGEAAKSP